MCSFRLALGDVGYIRGRSVHLCSPLASLGSSGVVGFTRVRRGGSWAHPGSLCSLGSALRVVPFIWCRWVNSCTPWVYPESLGSLELVYVALPTPVGVWSMAFGLRQRFEYYYYYRLFYFTSMHNNTKHKFKSRIQPPPLTSIQGQMKPLGWLGSSGVVGFTRVRPGGRWVHSGLFGSLWFAIGVVGFIRVHPGGRSVCSEFRWVHPRSMDLLGSVLG